MSNSNTNDPRPASRSIDAHFSILASTECRYVVYYFQRADDRVASLGELAGFVASNTSAETGKSREQVETILHHRALPKLADSHVVEYDQSDGTVRYHGNQGLEEFATIASRAERQTGWGEPSQ